MTPPRPSSERTFLLRIDSHWTAAAASVRRSQPDWPLETVAAAARRLVELLVFLRMGQERGLLAGPAPSPSTPLPRGERGEWGQPLSEVMHSIRERWGTGLLEAGDGERAVGGGQWVPEGAREGRLPGSVEILGTIHQRLLSRRLELTGDGQVSAAACLVERKKGGVFYTPECAVQYIVRQALAERAGTRVIDPACGCGAFLLAAYRHLLGDGQTQEGLERRLDAVALVHGVDLDPDAVLASRRALWLEAMAGGESDHDARKLSDLLANNIRCGDILLDSDLGRGPSGFDAVIGNPPYRRELNTKHLLDPIAASEFGRRYRAPRMDLWYYFVHRGLELLRPGGKLSFIVGAYWTSGTGAQRLIRALGEEAHIDEIFQLDRLAVFPGVSGRHTILTVTKGRDSRPTTVKTIPPDGGPEAEPYLAGKATLLIFCKTAEQLFRRGRIDLEPPAAGLLEKLACGMPLGLLGQIRQGIAENPASITRKTNEQHGNRWRVGEGVFALTDEELRRFELSESEAALVRPYYDLCDLGRYRIAASPSLRLIYSTADTWPEVDHFPRLRDHLARFRPILDARRETRQQTRAWWQLHWPREERLWESAKVVALQMAPRPSFVPASGSIYVPFSVNVFVPHGETREHLNYFAAVLNSRVLWAWFRHHAKRRGVGLEINGHVLAEAPIRRINFPDAADRARHDRLAEMVEQMMALVRKQPSRNSQRETALEGEIQVLDQQIDRVVAELYALTDEESASLPGER